MKIKTRFAPSPTGSLHLGNIRTALYSWLFAKNHGGTFILRIEDTDLERSSLENVNIIIDEMRWLNLDWDEGPFFQSKNFNRYNQIIEKMLSKGSAYRCYCSKERLKNLRDIQILSNKKPKYDGYCFNNRKHIYVNTPYTVRFKNPLTGTVNFNDEIRGNIEFKNSELDDLIIQRTDGYPTYNFCVAIDDSDMEISHVIRGDDHINNTPRQINILKSLNMPIPKYAHLSMILDHNKKKISKRQNIRSISHYRDDGFLPEAILNYLVRLGWSQGNQEIFSIKEMQMMFNFNSINKSPSIFDYKKLLWMNFHYIKNLDIDYISTHFLKILEKEGMYIYDSQRLFELISLLRTRCKTLKDMITKHLYLYQDFKKFDSLETTKFLQEKSIVPLRKIHKKFSKLEIWTVKSINNVIQQISNEINMKTEQINMILRMAITGQTNSPPLENTIYLIGKSYVLSRIDKSILYIMNHNIL